MQKQRVTAAKGGGSEGERGLGQIMGMGGCEEVNNYLRHVLRECETGINMWHPGDEQSAAADMTTKLASDSVASWVGQEQ
ncbi:hypothetical protein ACLKA7_011984 [Drosophila subpalustris]